MRGKDSHSVFSSKVSQLGREIRRRRPRRPKSTITERKMDSPRQTTPPCPFCFSCSKAKPYSNRTGTHAPGHRAAKSASFSQAPRSVVAALHRPAMLSMSSSVSESVRGGWEGVGNCATLSSSSLRRCDDSMPVLGILRGFSDNGVAITKAGETDCSSWTRETGKKRWENPNQSINQSIDQSSIRSISQSTDQSNNQSMNQSIEKSNVSTMNPKTNRWSNRFGNEKTYKKRQYFHTVGVMHVTGAAMGGVVVADDRAVSSSSFRRSDAIAPMPRISESFSGIGAAMVDTNEMGCAGLACKTCRKSGQKNFGKNNQAINWSINRSKP